MAGAAGAAVSGPLAVPTPRRVRLVTALLLPVLVFIERQGGEDLGGDQLGRFGDGEHAAGGARGGASGHIPLPADVGTAPHLEDAAGSGVLVQRARFEGTAVHGAHHLGELLRRDLRGAGDPARLVLTPGQAGQQAHLRPAERPAEQGLLQRGKEAESLTDQGQALDPTSREPQPLHGVIGEPRVTDALPGANDHQAPRDPGQDGSQRASLAAQCLEPSVDCRQAFGLLSVMHCRFREGCHARSPSGDIKRRESESQQLYHPMLSEQSIL